MPNYKSARLPDLEASMEKPDDAGALSSVSSRCSIRVAICLAALVSVQLCVFMGIVVRFMNQTAEHTRQLSFELGQRNATTGQEEDSLRRSLGQLESALHDLSMSTETLAVKQRIIEQNMDVLEAKVREAPATATAAKQATVAPMPVFNENVKQKFDEISVNNFWGSHESVSGPGSEVKITQTVRGCIGQWIQKYKIKVFLDLPCGDANWQHLIEGMDQVEYHGFDIAQNSIDRAKRKNSGNSNMHFGLFDIGSSVPMKADVHMMRDVIQHWPTSFALQALRNSKASGTTYLLASTYPSARGNTEVPFGGYYGNNLQLSPFNFPEPLESCENYDGKYRSMGSKMQLFALQTWDGSR